VEKIMKQILITIALAASLAATAATPANAWCNTYGCDYGYDNSGAMIAGGIMGLAVGERNSSEPAAPEGMRAAGEGARGAMIAGAAAQQAQQAQAPVCTARNGNPRLMRGRGEEDGYVDARHSDRDCDDREQPCKERGARQNSRGVGLREMGAPILRKFKIESDVQCLYQALSQGDGCSGDAGR
jgi:hypothetical protein